MSEEKRYKVKQGRFTWFVEDSETGQFIQEYTLRVLAKRAAEALNEEDKNDQTKKED